MFKVGTMVQATVDGQIYCGKVTVSDATFTQFIDQTDETRTVIARNREDRVIELPETLHLQYQHGCLIELTELRDDRLTVIVRYAHNREIYADGIVHPSELFRWLARHSGV